LKKYWNQTWQLFAFMSVIIILDQLTKWLVRSNLDLGEVWMPLVWLAPYARIVHWFNTGVAFGMLQGLGKYSMIFSILVVAFIMYYFPQVSRTDWLIRLALAMQAGGAIGNLIDRITIGHVTDFISVGTFPVWNVADASLTVSVPVLLLGLWLQDRRAVKQPPLNGGETE